jgi:hypothetical protein
MWTTAGDSAIGFLQQPGILMMAVRPTVKPSAANTMGDDPE